MKIAVMIGVVCAAMLACGGRPDTEDRLREAEQQLSIAEERLAAYEDENRIAAYEKVIATAAAQDECNYKIAAALLVATAWLAEQYPDEEIYVWGVHRAVEVQVAIETRRYFIGDSIERWGEEITRMVDRYLAIHIRDDVPALDIVAATDDLRSGEC